MAMSPVDLRLIGRKATNPAVPKRDVEGRLSINNGNLVFSGGGITHKIPLEHIDKLYVNYDYDNFGNDGRALVTVILTMATFMLCFGLQIPFLVYYFWWENTTIEVQIVVQAWDEYHGLNATTVFSLGKKRSYRDDAPAIIKQIWDTRGAVGREAKKDTIVYRQA